MTFMNARHPSLFTDDGRGGRPAVSQMKIRTEKERLPVGSRLNGLDDILAASRRRARLAMQMS